MQILKMQILKSLCCVTQEALPMLSILTVSELNMADKTRAGYVCTWAIVGALLVFVVNQMIYLSARIK